jgi:peptide/nickel transport system substrate-binding protein
MRVFRVGAVAAALLGGACSVFPAGAKTLRLALHSDLKIVDPIWTTALISTYHGYMVYDTLFALDEQLAVRPQMVARTEVSADQRVWTFVLRDGLVWQDGQPVTGADCVASLRRWAARDTMGQKLFAQVTDLSAPDAKTIRMTLREPYGLVLQTLAKSGANVPFMMPRRLAETDPNTQLTASMGSGPFIFKQNEWRPGDKAVYVRNPAYHPRTEAASGLAGGKVARVDRVEWQWIGDPQTQVNALLAGEVDAVEAPPHDLLPLPENDPAIALTVVTPQGRQYAFRFNTLNKPFDNPKVRQAVAYAFNQEDFLRAAVGNPKWYRVCKSLMPCGTPLETTSGWDDKLNGDVATARRLLREAGYDGTPIVLLQSPDVASLSNLAPVAKAALEKAGFKVDLQVMDWQTLVARRAKKDGWHGVFTSWSSVEILDPVANAFLNASCDRAPFGWPCDAKLEQLRDAFAHETDPAKQRAIAVAVTRRAAEYPTYLPLGQYVQPTAMRKNVSGVLKGPAFVDWNISVK